MTAPQQEAVYTLLSAGVSALFHGDCSGADFNVGEICRRLQIPVGLFPSTSKTRGWSTWGVYMQEPTPPLARNKDIVNAGAWVLACPGEMHEERRSGTWAAVRYARKAGKPIVFVWPNGKVTKEQPQ